MCTFGNDIDNIKLEYSRDRSFYILRHSKKLLREYFIGALNFVEVYTTRLVWFII